MLIFAVKRNLFFLVGAKLFQLLISFAKADGSGREAG
jgi:hypothetical protein